MQCQCLSCPIHGPLLIDREEAIYPAVEDGRLDIWTDGTIWRGGQRAEKPKGRHLSVRARVNKRLRLALAHRLVYYHFYGPIPPGLVVNHIDGNPWNNRPENLEAITQSENLSHPYRKLGRKHWSKAK